MGAKRWIVGSCVFFLSVATSWAGDAVETAAGSAPAQEAVIALSASTVIAGIEPWIHGDMPDEMRARLEAGFDLAVEKIHEVPACRDLFEQLGADPLETLRTGLYFPINSHRKRKAVCGRAAMYVLHEALHHAGLTEKPHDQGAMTSREINTMVTTACQL